MRYVVSAHNSNAVRQSATTFSRNTSGQLMCKRRNMAHSVLNTFSLILTFVVQSVAVNLVGCGPDKPLVVQENTQNYTIVCEDIRSDNDVRWVLTRTISNRTGSNIGYCPGDSLVCSGGNPFISFSRPSRNVSIVQIAKVNRSDFGEANITCSGISQTGESVVINSSCDMDIIYIAENISCKTEFMKDTWTVFGHCDIYKTSSSQNRYRCTWIEINESLRESVVIANTPMTVVPFVGTYVNGSCNFTSHLPPAGLYTYHVTVIPGEVTVNASFIGSKEICRPSSTPYHNCPQYLPKSKGVTCECFVDDLGSPPGVVLWNTTRSPELRLTDSQVIHNMSHVCQLLWNNTFVRSVEYVVNIADSPRVLTFNMNNIGSKTVNVDENAHVEMRCNSDGKPTPKIQLVNVSNPFNLLNQSHTQVSYIINQAPCEASGIYRCDVNNSIGQDSQSCILLVSCAPKKANIDGNPPTVNVTNGSGVLTVNMTAYPQPQIKTSVYLGTNDSSDGHPVKENSVYAACSNTLLAPASVTCNVIVINMTHNDEGFYKIVFSNSLGDLPFTFFVKVPENDQQAGAITKTDEKIAGVVVLAVMLSVVVVLNLVAVIWVWRRGWTLPCADVTNQRSTHQNQSSGDTSEHYLTPVTTNTLSTTQGRATPLYDALQMKDVGMQSHYEGLRQQHTGSEISSNKDLSSNMRKTRNEPIYVN